MKVSKIPEKTETVVKVIEEEKIVLEMTKEEACFLRTVVGNTYPRDILQCMNKAGEDMTLHKTATILNDFYRKLSEKV